MVRFLIALFAASRLFSMQGYFDARYHFNKGIGYEKGYTTFELFALQPVNSSLLLLGDVRTHFLNQGETAVNAGLGARYGDSWSRYIYGAHLFYDYRKLNREGLNQISFGAEALGECFDVRVEGYSPWRRKITSCEKETFHRFQGRHAILTGNVKASLPFISGELAYRFCLPKACGGNFLSLPGISGVASISPYYLFGEQKKGVQFGRAAGVQGLLKLCLTNWLYAEAVVTHDRIYKTLGQGVVGISFPFGKCERCVPCRAFRAIQRQEIIPIQEKSFCAPFVNRAANEPYRFLFVNEDLFGTGKGTFEKPYTRLSVASLYSKPNDIFLVTPTEQGLLEEVALKRGQKLWVTTGENHLGGITLPAVTPFLRRLASVQTFITLTKDNEVKGFYFSGTGNETGIYSGNLKGNHVISHCVFENLNRGIDLTARKNASVRLVGNTFDSIVEESILVANSGGTLSVYAKNNTFSNASNGMSFNFEGRGRLSLLNNQMQNISDNGIVVTGPRVKADISRNRIEASGMPISMTYESGNVSIGSNILTSLTERVVDINVAGGVLNVLNNRLFGVTGFEVLYLRRIGEGSLVADIYQNHFLSTDFADKFYVQDDGSILSNWGDASLLKLKVLNPRLGVDSLNSQNFGGMSADNAEFVQR